MPRYRSLRTQTLHYFSRPHDRVMREALDVAAAWRGAELTSDAWTYELDRSEIDELEAALAASKRRRRETAELVADDFPLSSLRDRISQWRLELEHGRGFVVIRGVPVDRWTPAEVERFFWCFGLHLGVPGAQNPEGHLLGHVRDTGLSAEGHGVRRYKTAADIAYHCDAADAVGLLCLRPAASGGRSRIVSSVSVYNQLLARRPDLAARLYRPFMLDTHGEGGVDYFPIRPCRHFRGSLRTFFHSDYFRSAFDYPAVAAPSGEDLELLDLYEQIAGDPDLYLEMDFEPGDIQLLSNHVVLHARTAYTDDPDPSRKRHLLRLWLSLPTNVSLGERLRRLESFGSLVGSLAANVIRQRARAARAKPARR